MVRQQTTTVETKTCHFERRAGLDNNRHSHVRHVTQQLSVTTSPIASSCQRMDDARQPKFAHVRRGVRTHTHKLNYFVYHLNLHCVHPPFWKSSEHPRTHMHNTTHTKEQEGRTFWRGLTQGGTVDLRRVCIGETRRVILGM